MNGDKREKQRRGVAALPEPESSGCWGREGSPRDQAGSDGPVGADAALATLATLAADAALATVAKLAADAALATVAKLAPDAALAAPTPEVPPEAPPDAPPEPPLPPEPPPPEPPPPEPPPLPCTRASLNFSSTGAA